MNSQSKENGVELSRLNNGEGTGMPAFREASFSDCEVSVKPRRVWCIFPRVKYLYGTNADFTMTISNIDLKYNAGKIPYKWKLIRWDGNYRHEVNTGDGEVNVSNNRAGEIIHAGYLSVTGHHILDVKVGSDTLDNSKDYILVANFTLQDRDIFWSQWQIALMGGFVGAILGALITLFGGKVSGLID